MRRVPRILALLALLAGVAAVAAVLLRDDSYTLDARFTDVGQLVEGGLVQVGGMPIGKIDTIDLDGDGVARVRMEITDGDYRDLPQGTRATIRSVGLSGVANRYIDLAPGPRKGAPIPDGGTLELDSTTGIVDLDLLLDAFDPPTRKRLRSLVRSGESLWENGAADDANAAFGYLRPALSQSDQLARELARDRVAVTRLLRTGATTSAALASRPEDVAQGIRSTAATLDALADERAALGSTLERAPALLNRPGGVFGGLRSTLATVRPTLRDARPAARPLGRVLARLVPVSRRLRPVLGDLRELLPEVSTAMRGMPALARSGVPALSSTREAVERLLPITSGLSPYVPDLVSGFIGGIGGKTTGYYDANGHYTRIALQTGSGALTGLLGGSSPPPQGRADTGNVRRCAGGAAPPAADGSNPFVPDPSICDPEQAP